MKGKVLIPITERQAEQRDFIRAQTGLQKKAIDLQVMEIGLNKLVSDINRKLKRSSENE